jgi:hypothetical protein
LALHREHLTSFSCFGVHLPWCKALAIFGRQGRNVDLLMARQLVFFSI